MVVSLLESVTRTEHATLGLSDGRGNERAAAAAAEIKGGPSNAPARHCLPHTRIREIRVSKASEPSNIRSERVRGDHKMRANRRRAENYADLSGEMAAADKSVSQSACLSGRLVRPAT